MRTGINISEDDYRKLSDMMLEITRRYNEQQKGWRNWTTSGWRYYSDEALDELLLAFIKIKKSKWGLEK